MADRTLRQLERAHASGQAEAQLPLAAAYLRQGRSTAALAVLGDAQLQEPEAVTVHEGAWGDLLRGLRPAWRTAGLSRPHVVGWTEGRAVLAVAGPSQRVDSLSLVSLDDGHVRQVINTLPLLVTAQGVLGRPVAGRNLMWLRAPDWVPEPMRDVLGPVSRIVVEPGGERAVVDGRLFRLPDLQLLTEAPRERMGAWDVCWERELLAWWQGPHVRVRPLEGGEAAPRWDPARELARRHPARAAALGEVLPEAPGLGFLADGRLWVGPPLAVRELDGERCWFPAGGDPRAVAGPLRLGLDGSSLLAFRAGAPCRLPLDGPPLPTAMRAAAGSGLWHPRAEVAVMRGQAPQLPGLLGVDGERLLSFPHGVRPLGWSPGGHELLVQRDLAGDGRGPLELWQVAA